MKNLRLIIVLFSLFIFGRLDASEEATEEGTQLTDAGLAVGQTAPAFTLKDQHGKDVSLESLLKKGPVAVVFHRSVDWCLYCKLQMVQVQRILKRIEGAGGQVVGISYDSAEKLKAYGKQQKITFPMLADPDSKTIDAFDIRYKQAPPEKSGFARHATFIIDQKGIIRAKLFRLSYQERPAVDELINALKEARQPKGKPNHENKQSSGIANNFLRAAFCSRGTGGFVHGGGSECRPEHLRVRSDRG